MFFLKQLIVDKYIIVFGFYCVWNRYVNFFFFDFVKEVFENDKYIYNYYDVFQYILYEINYVEMEDRIIDFRIIFFGFGIFIVILVLLVECMVILLEGG